jgi:hypothetical protein
MKDPSLGRTNGPGACNARAKKEQNEARECQDEIEAPSHEAVGLPGFSITRQIDPSP